MSKQPKTSFKSLVHRLRLPLAAALVAFLALTIGFRLFTATASSEATYDNQLSSIFTPEVRYWSPLIYAWASAYHVDPNLIATVIQIESCGDPKVISPSGAQGLFQVMPSHFSAGEDMLNVINNGKRGMEYLAEGLQLAAGDPGLALAGYNGGHGAITSGWAHWSEQTKRYYQWGISIYSDASKGLAISTAIQSWLNAGGTRLCNLASTDRLVASR
jgi:soluble lytic murein transglycosylase-like protein